MAEAAPEARIWNVCVPVIMNLSAPTGDDAQARLAQALRDAGFEPFVDNTTEISTTPFESEAGVEADDLPDSTRIHTGVLIDGGYR